LQNVVKGRREAVGAEGSLNAKEGKKARSSSTRQKKRESEAIR